MRTTLFYVTIISLLTGCSALPGMQNLDTSTIHTQKEHRPIRVDPILIPITASSLIERTTKPYVYRIGSEDVLSVNIWNHNELNTPVSQMSGNITPQGQSAGATGYLVDNLGNIYLPLIGSVHVAGKTINEVHTLITNRFSYYLRKPQIILRVADYRSKKVYVMGEVLKPGYLQLNDQPLSITAALNLSGSFDPNAADPRHIYVIRGKLTRPEIYWLDVASPTDLLLGERFLLRQNDIVVVSTATVTRWNRFLNQLLPTLQTVWYTQAITRN
jgi:polysaccharide export outer membrane protein